jgi:putative transposase
MELLFMVNVVQKKVKNHLSNEKLKKLIKNAKKDCGMFKKYSLIYAVKNGKKVSEACEFLHISEPTGHRWLDRYNEEGETGLKPNYENMGRPPKLSAEFKDELPRILENEDNLTPQRVYKIIHDRYGVDYSLRQIDRIMEELGFNYGKPYQIFSQKPKDAEPKLKKT